VLVLVCVLLLAGCGSSSKSESHTATGSSTILGSEIGELPGAPTKSRLPPTPAPGAHVDPSYLRAVFADAQRFWGDEFAGGRLHYVPAGLVLFASTVHSGCGVQENTGPFYCPASRTIYLDTPFFAALAQQARLGGFAQAYIVGHEFGHHVQHLLGIDARVAAANKADPHGENARSVQVELQADCLSGVWAHSLYSREHVSVGDLEDALRTAALVGDDFQARAAGKTVDPGLFTHGSSAQRQHWLATGFESGRPDACDTFSRAAA
jgi:predicted metalloprotease